MLYVFFFFKQKTAYEMRISDWSSDVCSSDLGHLPFEQIGDGGQTDMRMRTHVCLRGYWGGQVVRPHAIEENEGTHHSALSKRQHPPYFKAPDIVYASFNDLI